MSREITGSPKIERKPRQPVAVILNQQKLVSPVMSTVTVSLTFGLCLMMNLSLVVHHPHQVGNVKEN